jgi:hypothetical protein
MPDGLYEHDVLAWSQHQAELLRRLGRGERVNDVDWTNLAEEIESVGLSELNAVKSFLKLIMLHVLKLHLSPDNLANRHWRGEIVAFRGEAADRFAPSMRQRIDMAALYAVVSEQTRQTDPDAWIPPDNPFTLDQLLKDDTDTMLNHLARLQGHQTA